MTSDRVPPRGETEPEERHRRWALKAEDIACGFGGALTEERLARLASAFAAFERDVLMLGAERIRVQCGPCEGRGYNPESHTEAQHGCGGDDRLCATRCPMPVEVLESIECEYCGRPIAALRAGAAPAEQEGPRG